MNPNSGETSQPFEEASAPSGEAAGSQTLEAQPVKSPEKQPQQSVQVSSQAASSMALPSQSIAQTFTDDSQAQGSSATHPAADTDRIEKVWVDRAKAVLAKTKDDPFTQKSQMSKVKAEYIKKRFNKTVKTDDAVA